jgi:hypothetical protein
MVARVLRGEKGLDYALKICSRLKKQHKWGPHLPTWAFNDSVIFDFEISCSNMGSLKNPQLVARISYHIFRIQETS